MISAIGLVALQQCFEYFAVGCQTGGNVAYGNADARGSVRRVGDDGSIVRKVPALGEHSDALRREFSS